MVLGQYLGPIPRGYFECHLATWSHSSCPRVCRGWTRGHCGRGVVLERRCSQSHHLWSASFNSNSGQYILRSSFERNTTSFGFSKKNVLRLDCFRSVTPSHLPDISLVYMAEVDSHRTRPTCRSIKRSGTWSDNLQSLHGLHATCMPCGISSIPRECQGVMHIP